MDTAAIAGIVVPLVQSAGLKLAGSARWDRKAYGTSSGRTAVP